MIKIVTVEREYGCGGGEIAQRLANLLGWKLWDHELTEEIARLANCSQAAVEQREERTDPLYYRLFKSFLRGSYEGSINAHKLNLVDSENILKMTERVVQHAASKGDFRYRRERVAAFSEGPVRGHLSRVPLRPDAKIKCGALLSRGKSEKDAQELVDTVDRERAGFIEKYFHVDWPDRAVYHIMINTAAGDETVVQAIVNFMKAVDSKFNDSKSNTP